MATIEIAFMKQFGDDKTSWFLFLDISRIKINKKEKAKDFNKRFITLMNIIIDKLAEVVKIKFYIVSLPPPIAMFIK